MTYTGTMLEDLQNIVEDLLMRSARICVICKQPFGYHSAVGGYCPDSKAIGPIFLPSTFADGPRH